MKQLAKDYPGSQRRRVRFHSDATLVLLPCLMAKVTDRAGELQIHHYARGQSWLRTRPSGPSQTPSPASL